MSIGEWLMGAADVWVKTGDLSNEVAGQRLKEKAIEISIIEARLASARAIMQKFVDKVDRGMARSIETYAEMKEWLDD